MTQLRTGLRWGLGLLVAGGLLGMTGPGHGQNIGVDSPTSRVAGTAAEFVLTVNPFLFQPLDAGQASLVGFGGGVSRFCSGNCNFLASLSLPSGALITGLELEAFDNDTGGRLSARVAMCSGMTNCQIVAQVATGIVATPGLVRLRGDAVPPHTVDSLANSYGAAVDVSGGTSDTRLIALRVFYRLQISPAPAVATFSDVPTTHPFFQFVEALAASGITVGCGVGIFCPDAPLTRGQMAVFLSRGLGLHFAP